MRTAVFIVVFTLGAYAWLGAPQVVLEQWRHARELEAAQPEIQRLEYATEKDTDNPNVWAELGRVYMETGQYSKSANAFRMAVLKSGGAGELILMYNKALVFAASGEVTDTAAQGFQVALKLLPGHPEARYFLALRKLQQGNAAEAMPEMKAIYHELPEGSPLKAVMNRQIGRE